MLSLCITPGVFEQFVVQSTHNKNHYKEDREHLGWKRITLGSFSKGLLRIIGNFCWWQVQLITSVDRPEWARGSSFLRMHYGEIWQSCHHCFCSCRGWGKDLSTSQFSVSVKRVEDPWGTLAWWEWGLLRRLPAHPGIKLCLQRSLTVNQEISFRWCLQLLMPWHSSQPCRSQTSTI